MNIYSLDIETAPTDPNDTRPVALEPWRLPMGQAKITDISVTGPDGSSLKVNPTKDETVRVLKSLKGKVVYMHYAVFDTAWLYATVKDIKLLTDIDIRDTALLKKWITNSQADEFSTNRDNTLAGLVRKYCSDEPDVDAFLAMKSEDQAIGENTEYWSQRAIADTTWTRILAWKLQKLLPEAQRRGFLISQKQIPYVARSWVNGTPFDKDKVKSLGPQISAGKAQLASKLGVPETTLTSTAQLSNLLFDKWGIDPISRGKTKKDGSPGAGSTKADDLKRIYVRTQGTELQEKMKIIMDFKKLQTLQSKYLTGFERVLDYVGKPVCHGSPRLFGTYTGRYTYSSKTTKKQIHQCSIAMHQIPRTGPVKKLFIADKDKAVGKYDASGQEIGFMAWASRDANMLHALNSGMNVHSWMATNLTGETYDEFIVRYKGGDSQAYQERQAAKLLNLSCQYRIGWKALQAKFFGTYDMDISDRQARNYLNTYKIAYPGVVNYWKSICIKAMNAGFAETIAGRRFYLTDWKDHKWGTESSAINTPIQGSGADQKDLIIWKVSEQFPEVQFTLDIHDEGIFYLPRENCEELNKDIVHFLNGLKYDEIWQTEVPMPLTFEGQIGKNFGECEEYAQPFNEMQIMKGLA